MQHLLQFDALGWTFAAAWPPAVMLALVRARPLTSRQGGGAALMALGLAGMALSGELVWLWLGWEVAGLGLWLATAQLTGPNRWLLLALHAPGWLLLLTALAGPGYPLVPPAGGAARVWTAVPALAIGVCALARMGGWPLNGWLREAGARSGPVGASLLSIYALAAPFSIARALVAARWDAQGTWLLALLGTLAMLSGAFAAFDARQPGPGRLGVASAVAGAAMLGFALAPGAAVAAAGALSLLLAAAFWSAAGEEGPLSAAALAIACSFGAWAVTQGALSLGYGLPAVLLLPAVALAALGIARRGVGRVRPLSAVVYVALLALGAYPQAALEWVIRPAARAMAGGVGALTLLRTDWGVGALLLSADETVRASLPAAGIALATGLAWVVLRWLGYLLAGLSSRAPAPSPASSEANPGAVAGIDSVLPGAEQAGRLLDPVRWAGSARRQPR